MRKDYRPVDKVLRVWDARVDDRVGPMNPYQVGHLVWVRNRDNPKAFNGKVTRVVGDYCWVRVSSWADEVKNHGDFIFAHYSDVKGV